MLKSNKGISLTTAVITVMVVIILLSALTYSAVNSIKVRRLNQLYNDIRLLNDEVAVYYLKHGKLPIKEDKIYQITTEDTASKIQSNKINFVLKEELLLDSESLVNPNDFEVDGTVSKAVYYKLNLSALDNVSLNNQGTFIINKQSHTIYYLDGVKVDDKLYHNLPLEYRDTKHNENNPVTQISLKDGMSYVYLPVGGTQLDLKDYLKFNADGKGEPRTLTYTSASSNNTYFTVENGIIKSKDVEPTTFEYSVTVDVTSYGNDTILSYNIPIKLTGIDIVNATDDSNIEEINLIKNGEVSNIKAVGYGSYGNIMLEPNYSIINSSISESEGIITINAVSPGTSKIIACETNGNATKEIPVNVYSFDMFDNNGNGVQNLNITSLKDTVELEIKKLGPDITFDNEKNKIVWESSNTGIVEVTGNSLSATVSPLEFGTATITCSIIINGEQLKTFSIPVIVTGVQIIGSGSNIMTITGGTTSTQTLSYSTNIVASQIQSCEWTSSSEPVATIVKNANNTATVTAHAVGETEITLEVTLTNNEKYKDTYKITVNSN